MPDDDQISNTGNRVPAPLLRCALTAKGSKEASKNHDHVSHDGHDSAGTIDTGKQTQVEQKQRRGQAPINITGPVDLTINILVGVRHMLVRLAFDDVVMGDTHAGGHGKVGQSSSDSDHGGDEVIETLGLITCKLELAQGVDAASSCGGGMQTYNWDVPRHEGEDCRSNQHDDKDDPIVMSVEFPSKERYICKAEDKISP